MPVLVRISGIRVGVIRVRVGVMKVRVRESVLLALEFEFGFVLGLFGSMLSELEVSIINISIIRVWVGIILGH